MEIEIVTKEDLEAFRKTLLEDIRAIVLGAHKGHQPKEWLRTNEVMELLGISMSTLQNLCINKVLHPAKVGGLNYYKYDDILGVLNAEKDK